MCLCTHTSRGQRSGTTTLFFEIRAFTGTQDSAIRLSSWRLLVAASWSCNYKRTLLQWHLYRASGIEFSSLCWQVRHFTELSPRPLFFFFFTSRITSNWLSSCLNLPGAAIEGIHHHILLTVHLSLTSACS